MTATTANIQTHKPTMMLRFVLRDGPRVGGSDEFPIYTTQRVLQQWWEELRHWDVNWTQPPGGEWRDVPLASESGVLRK